MNSHGTSGFIMKRVCALPYVMADYQILNENGSTLLQTETRIASLD